MPVSSVRRRLSRFIQAIISTSPVAPSCAIAGIRPWASYFSKSRADTPKRVL